VQRAPLDALERTRVGQGKLKLGERGGGGQKKVEGTAVARGIRAKKNESGWGRSCCRILIKAAPV